MGMATAPRVLAAAPLAVAEAEVAVVADAPLAVVALAYVTICLAGTTASK